MNTLNIMLINLSLTSFVANADEVKNYERMSNAQEARFNKIFSREKNTFNTQEESILKKWNEMASSTNKILVHYYDNNNIRLMIDYESGEIEFATIGKTIPEIKRALNLLISDHSAPTKSSVMNLEDLDYVKKSKSEFVNDLLDQVKTNSIDQKADVRSRINFKMISGHIKARAKKYFGIVKKWSEVNNVEPELVMAMIRQESAFNPLAQSHIPAYGLMQIVPKYAGRDVMRLLRGKDEDPSKSSLFDPEINVMFGTSYIKILKDKFQEFTNDKSKIEQLVIASYNWGPDRIIKALKSKRISIEKSDLHEQIRSIAPEETKDYLKKIVGYKKEFAFKE